jgi:hypothetical protein
MEREFLVSAGAAVAFFVVSSLWVSSGISPANVRRMHTQNQLDLSQDLKLVSEHSPYMRNER